MQTPTQALRGRAAHLSPRAIVLLAARKKYEAASWQQRMTGTDYAPLMREMARQLIGAGC